jgi:hypothetical protein
LNLKNPIFFTSCSGQIINLWSYLYLNRCRWFVYKLLIANLTIKSALASIGSDRNIGSEAMEEETVMVADETMATDFLESNTGLSVVGAFILALLASDDNLSSSTTTN